MVLSTAVIPGIAWLCKTYEPISLGIWLPYFNSTPVTTVDLSQALTVNLPLYFKALALLVNTALYNVFNMNFSLLDIPVAIIFLAALGISFVSSIKRPNICTRSLSARHCSYF